MLGETYVRVSSYVRIENVNLSDLHNKSDVKGVRTEYI